MFRTKLIELLLILGVIVSASPKNTMAEELPETANAFSSVSEEFCSDYSVDKKIEEIAELLIRGEESEEAVACYESLSDEGKAKVFETVAILRGFSVDDLRRDAEGMKQFSQTTNPLAAWDQLIERVPFSAVGKPLVSAIYYFQHSTICDGDASDIDYIFVYVYPSNMTNPDALRVFSSNLLVDSMLVYYQITIGGLKGYGDTGSTFVHVCVGDTGVANAGGASNVQDKMKTHN